MVKRGKFIVIEGSDGSGKSTHFQLLKEYFQATNQEVSLYKFPRYEEPSSHFVTSYLNGKYGDAGSLGAYTPSLFYALDRFEGGKEIKKDLDAGKTVLCDRYFGSNMAHQGQKIDDDNKRLNYYAWLCDLEFNILGIPKPDLNLVLLMPADQAQILMNNREVRSYTKNSHDIHEADINHLSRTVNIYRELCKLFPNHFTPVECTTEQGKLKTIEEIHQEIRAILAVG